MGIFKRFAKSETGHVAIMFGLSLVPVIAAVGAMIDLARFTSAHTQLQAALNAGTLAAAATRDASDLQRIKIAKDVFAATMKQGETTTIVSTLNFTIANGTVTSTANYVFPTALMAIVGIGSLEMDGSSEATISDFAQWRVGGEKVSLKPSPTSLISPT
jgi:Flp pilus assembly protein TadG